VGDIFIYMDIKQKYAILKFIQFTKTELGITLPFKIVLGQDKALFKTYAYYNPQTNSVAVYVVNRATADIMRSFAHELVHHKQTQMGEIKPGVAVKDVGGKIEDDANAIAGQLIKKFGYANPTLKIWDTTI
jgi:hypothetical protein